MNYWCKPYVMLSTPLMRVRCKFATALGERVLFWAYHWLRGKGGYLMERDSIQPLLLTVFFALTTEYIFHDDATISLSRNIMTVCVFIFIYSHYISAYISKHNDLLYIHI